MPTPRSGPGLRPQPNDFAAASSTARIRSSLRFLSRKASGSSWSERASSSTCDSRAKWFAVAASARYDPWRSGDCDWWNAMSWLGTL
jgi:hypothetical protein